MKVLNVKETSGLVVKSLLIAVMLLQVCIFASSHKAERSNFLSSNCHRPDLVWVQHTGLPRFALPSVTPFDTPGLGLVPLSVPRFSSKSACFKNDVNLFQKGGIALALTTINAP